MDPVTGHSSPVTPSVQSEINLATLPLDVLNIIFSHLDPHSQARTSRVCTRFNRVLKTFDFKRQSIKVIHNRYKEQCAARLPVFLEAVGGYKEKDSSIWEKSAEIEKLTDEELPLFAHNIRLAKRDHDDVKCRNIFIPLVSTIGTVVCCAMIALLIFGIVKAIQEK